MNKKLILALAVPAVMASCSQEDLVTENIAVANPQKAISGLTFNVAKNESGVESRANWIGNKIQFEKSDLISLYWLGSDGYEQNNTTGYFTPGNVILGSNPLEGKSNAVYRTEDGSSFSAEAVVYEGYNLLVFPANTSHTTSQAIEVKIPQAQSASKDFTENVIYVGDSIMQIHQPAYNSSNGKYYDMYHQVAKTDDPNTSGYAHGIKTGVKLLTSLLNLDLQIQNAPANDVKINKVELTTADGSAIYSVKGNLLAGDESTLTDCPSMATYMNPWYKNADAKASLTLDFTGVTTNLSSTKGTMVLLPATDLTKQPVLKVHTNYGIVTVGGGNSVGTTHTNCIYKADGKTYAAANDDAALQEIVEYATNYEVTTKLWKSSTRKNETNYTFNSGVSMTRVIKVDMQQANIQNMHVKNTAELNAVLNSAISNTNSSFSTSAPLNVYLDYDANGNFVLTDYVGLDKFVTKYGAGKLNLVSGTKTTTAGTATQLTTVTVNTSDVTALKNIEGLNSGVKLIIPASSSINTIKNGTANADYALINPIINKTTLTVPAYANVTLADNTNAQVNYTHGAGIDVTALTDATYGKIYYKATSKANLEIAAVNNVNYILVENITSGFFSGGLDLSAAPAQTICGITVEFSNCGNLNETISNSSSNVINTATIVLSNGTSYPNMTYAAVENVIVKSATATLAVPTTSAAKAIESVVVENGSAVSINNLDIETLTVKNSAVAELGAKALAPQYFYIYGTASFAGDNRQANGKVFTDTDSDGKIEVHALNVNKCLVTGTLNLSKDMGYQSVAVSETTRINVVEGVTGLGYAQNVYVTKDSQAKNTINLKYDMENTIYKYSWSGNVVDLTW